MSESTPSNEAVDVGMTRRTGLADGEWHHLHPATPLLRGGITLLAVIGVIIASMRDRWIDLFFGGDGEVQGDPVLWILEQGYIGIAALVVLVGLGLFVAGFYVSWRMHTFRITEEVVEVRSGILFRTNRKGRLDRIQGINIQRPFIARLLGAARLEVNVAGQDANVQLAYLSSANSDSLRRDILRLASGTQAVAQETERDGTAVDQRVSELLGPELDPNAAPPESVVKMNTGRLLGSIVLNDSTLTFAAILIGSFVVIAFTGEPLALLGIAPVFLGLGGFIISRFTKSLRYSIASTPDGVRVGFGLLTTTNETLPPGRIHSVQVSQPLLWRPAGWWEIKVNRASKSSTSGAAGQQNTTILPVGNLDDVMRVLGLLLPGLVDEQSAGLLHRGLTSKGDDDFVNSPARARVLRWFSQGRNGYAFGPDTVLLRKGRIWRQLVIVPQPRVQSVSLQQGPIYRWLRVARIRVHTVAGPISAELGAVDNGDAIAFFAAASRAIVDSARADTSHRWRAGETPL